MSGFRFRGLADYRQAYRDGSTTPSAVAERLIAAVREAESASPAPRPFLSFREEEIEREAAAATERIARRKPLGPLDGVPIAVTDEVHQAGHPTTVGTSFLGTIPEREDATVVARLREAGALLVGKLHMHEIGLGGTGINPHHGACRNPYDLGRVTGGSSSGSGAATASGLVPVALGADAGGWIRIPASFCGVVGIKPTFGRVSQHGAVPLCWSLAHLGPLAATVADAAELLTLIAGPDPLDPRTLGQPPLVLGKRAPSVEGKRLGVCPDLFDQADPDVVHVCRTMLDRLVAAGAEIVRLSIRDLDLVRPAQLITTAVEVAASQYEHLQLNRMDYGPDTRLILEGATRLSGVDYVRAQRARSRIERSLREALGGVDALVAPTCGCVAPPIRPDAESSGELDEALTERITMFSFPANLTGYPAVSVPAGHDPSGMPVGLQLIGGPWEEATLIEIAAVVERLADRLPPAHHWDLLA